VIQAKFASQGLNAEVQLAKLERMKQYADALSCRRKILSYFGELVTENCGNCDICKIHHFFLMEPYLLKKHYRQLLDYKKNHYL
jgi:ATP-dependent DNA helicase RecQ